MGIFGRENVFAATRSGPPGPDRRSVHLTPPSPCFATTTAAAARFGSVGLAATTSDIEPAASIYASLDNQQRVVIVALNKSTLPLLIEISVKRMPPSGHAPGFHAEVYQLTRSQAHQPVRVNDLLVDSVGTLHCELPSQSISTLVWMPTTPNRIESRQSRSVGAGRLRRCTGPTFRRPLNAGDRPTASPAATRVLWQRSWAGKMLRVLFRRLWEITPMPAQFDSLGISFQYPENWTLDDSDALLGRKSITVYSPGGAFWAVVIIPARPIRLRWLRRSSTP